MRLQIIGHLYKKKTCGWCFCVYAWAILISNLFSGFPKQINCMPNLCLSSLCQQQKEGEGGVSSHINRKQTICQLHFLVNCRRFMDKTQTQANENTQCDRKQTTKTTSIGCDCVQMVHVRSRQM